MGHNITSGKSSDCSDKFTLKVSFVTALTVGLLWGNGFLFGGASTAEAQPRGLSQIDFDHPGPTSEPTSGKQTSPAKEKADKPRKQPVRTESPQLRNDARPVAAERLRFVNTEDLLKAAQPEAEEPTENLAPDADEE